MKPLPIVVVLLALSCAGFAADSEKELTNSVGMKLVRIEPGTFTMGQDGPPADHFMKKHPAEFDRADWDEKPAHRVTITRSFHIGATEVTLGQFRHFDADFRKNSPNTDDALHGVSWTRAVAFCEWLSKREGRTYRLPTEAEWEYACRAGRDTLFHTGDALPPGHQKWFGGVSYRSYYFPDGAMPPDYTWSAGPVSLRVAQRTPNAWGLHDMHGNVAEWCLDWYGPYAPGEQRDPLGPRDGDFRVFRGGGHSEFTRLLRSANRGAWLPDSAMANVGFRVVMGDLPAGSHLAPPPPELHARDVAQTVPQIEPPPSDTPFFEGPRVFVHIPPGSAGPLYSWHNHSPAIAECPNGDLLAIWYSCVEETGTELTNVASRLRRGAAAWEPASPFWDGADVNDHAPKLWWDGERTLFHFSRGVVENILRTSTDNGASWSKARALRPMDELGNQPIRTRDGTLLITHDSRFVSLMISKDRGATWSPTDALRGKSDFRPRGKGFRHAGIHAPIVELSDGRLMTIGRYDEPALQEQFGGKTPVSYSSDLGATWSYEASGFSAISSAQRAVLLRLREGPLLLCSFTDQARDWKNRKGLRFKAADGSEFTGYGLFAALSFDDGRTWPDRRLITPGGPSREVPSIDRAVATLSDTMAERSGYLAATQTRDGRVQLLTSKNHYVFNVAWLKALPPAEK